MDSRQRKTRAKLAAAVLALASERSASSLTASELAIAAGINRSTFYQHASSPVGLLEDVLRDELDAIRDEYLGGPEASGTPEGGDATDTPDAIEQVTLAVLRHVNEHAAIYGRGLGAGSGSASLAPMLSAQFATTLAMLLDRHALSVPTVADARVPAHFVPDAAARFIADGTVGTLDVWLRTPEPRDPEAFMAAYRLFLPAWWPR